MVQTSVFNPLIETHMYHLPVHSKTRKFPSTSQGFVHRCNCPTCTKIQGRYIPAITAILYWRSFHLWYNTLTGLLLVVPVQGLHGPCFGGFVNCCVFDAVRSYGASFPPFQCASIGTAYFWLSPSEPSYSGSRVARQAKYSSSSSASSIIW